MMSYEDDFSRSARMQKCSGPSMAALGSSSLALSYTSVTSSVSLKPKPDPLSVHADVRGLTQNDLSTIQKLSDTVGFGIESTQ
jgi:hypothetical protein